jgi:uncharacterized membrane protein YccF (DUF307 family)
VFLLVLFGGSMLTNLLVWFHSVLFELVCWVWFGLIAFCLFGLVPFGFVWFGLTSFGLVPFGLVYLVSQDSTHNLFVW